MIFDVKKRGSCFQPQNTNPERLICLDPVHSGSKAEVESRNIIS
jgi:hypothetical protein